MSLIISEIWSTKLSKLFKINELARPLGAPHLEQGLVSPPGPPNQVSVHLWHPTRVEHTWQPTRGVLGGTRLHIQHENVSSIDSKNERLNLWRKASFLYPSICPFISDTSVIKFSKTSSLWVLTSDLLLFGNGEPGTFSSKVCRRLSRSCSSQQTPFSIPLSRNLILNLEELKQCSYTSDEHAYCSVTV